MTGRTRTSIRSTLAAVTLAALLGACESPAPATPAPPTRSSSGATPSEASPTTVSVAFLQDLSAEGAPERTLPVLHAVELAFATAALEADDEVEIEVVPFDVGESADAPTEAASEIAADPAFAAAIAAPDLGGQDRIVDLLAPAAVPLVSLSGRGSVTNAPAGAWVRLVAPVRAQGEALARAAASLRAARRGVCTVTAPADGTVYGKVMRRSLPDEIPVTEVAGAAEAVAAGCGVVVWPGGAEAGAELAAGLAAAEDPPVLVGGPALQAPEFVELAGEVAEGAISLCSCADVSTSLDLEAQRFIQDYQSEFGSPPGPYAVEAWDAGRFVDRAIRLAGPARDHLMDWIASSSIVTGLAGSYLVEGGELADPASAIRRSRVEGGRWVSVPG